MNIRSNLKDLFIRFCVCFVDCLCPKLLQVDTFTRCGNNNMEGSEDAAPIQEPPDPEVLEADPTLRYIRVSSSPYIPLPGILIIKKYLIFIVCVLIKRSLFMNFSV